MNHARTLAVLVAIAGAASGAWAQGISISIDPAETIAPSISPGSAFSVTVMCSSTRADVTCADFCVDFDPELLQFTGSVPGTFWNFGQGFFTIRDGVNNGIYTHTAGRYWLASFLLGNQNLPPPGDYSLVILNFKVLAVGSTAFTLSAGEDMSQPGRVPPASLTMFSNPLGENIVPASIGNGTFSNDGPGIIVYPLGGGLATHEAGGTSTFKVTLNQAPTADVRIPLSVPDATEATVAPASLTFTPANWDVPQAVTVTGVNDDLVDGNVDYAVVMGPATSGDARFSGMQPRDVVVTNVDDDQPAVLTSVGSLETFETGGATSFTLVLSSAPSADVSVPLTVSLTREASIDQDVVTFTPDNWNIPREVIVTSKDDLFDDDTVTYFIRLGALVSDDLAYLEMDPRDVVVTGWDDADTAGIEVTGTGGLTVTEGGASDSFSVVLKSQPLGSLVVGLGADAVQLQMPTSLTFTMANWNVPQVVTVSALNDAREDGDVAVQIAVEPRPTQNNMKYSHVVVPRIPVLVKDDGDKAGMNVSSPIVAVTGEDGRSVTFTINLLSDPAAEVSIPITCSNAEEGSVSPEVLHFDSSNWQWAQVVAVTGVNDHVLDGDTTFTVNVGAADSADLKYKGRFATQVALTNADDDINLSLVSLESTSGSPLPGEAVTLTLRMRNVAQLDATGVIVAVALPAFLAMDSSTADRGSLADGFWTVGSLAKGAEATLTITATASETATGGNTVRAWLFASDQEDVDAAGNEITKTVSLGSPESGNGDAGAKKGCHAGMGSGGLGILLMLAVALMARRR